jgi:DnaJ-class molecular chaperone
MDCVSCDGDGFLVFGNGKTKECISCDGTGKIFHDEED